MAVRLRLGNYEPLEADPLERSFIGYFPRMTEAEAWEVGRGVWRMNAEKASRQRFAVIVGEGQVRAVGEIHGVSVHGDRVALDGTVLAAGHPVRDAWIGEPDPVVNGSQNPVGYAELPEEQQFLYQPCGCGCGEPTDRDFRPGHEVRAMQDRVRTHCGGSVAAFLHWVNDSLNAGRPAHARRPTLARRLAADYPDLRRIGCYSVTRHLFDDPAKTSRDRINGLPRHD